MEENVSVPTVLPVESDQKICTTNMNTSVTELPEPMEVSPKEQPRIKQEHEQLKQEQLQKLRDETPLEPVPTSILTKSRLREVIKEVDKNVHLDDDVEDIMIKMIDEFVDSTINYASLLAKNRKASSLDVKDVQLYLERNWNMWIPGLGSEDLKLHKKTPVTEAHKQRMALIRKTMKKY